MALFGRKKINKDLPAQAGETPIKDVSEKKEKKTVSSAVFLQKDYARVLRAPRITEKATTLSEKGVYVFEVDVKATKHDVMRAIEDLYKVKPVKVNISQIPAKKVSSKKRGVFGMKARGKKAYIYLKKGDTIEIV